MADRTIPAKKVKYEAKVSHLLETYEKVLIVGCDHVGSKQFQDIRASLRGRAVVLMGKNTLIKKCIRVYVERTGDDKWEALLEHLVGNVGIIFTAADLGDIREEVLKFKMPAPAKGGVIAPVSVTVPSGNTGLDPSSTSFFQALNIPTKINKGTVEITSDMEVIKEGEPVSASAAALLAKLNITPFSYNLIPLMVFDNGELFDAAVLDITEEDIIDKFMSGVQQIAALCLGANYPTLASVPHSIVNSYKNVLAIALETEYSFPLADKVKDMLANPGAYAAAAPAAAVAAPAAAAAPVEESEEEDMAFDLFG
jgi:large subunit ribosomal protein LP0